MQRTPTKASEDCVDLFQCSNVALGMPREKIEMCVYIYILDNNIIRVKY